jgi:probable HAF family extracellular repeat protein
MKYRTLMCFAATIVFAALSLPIQLAAQGDTAQEHHAKHHHYKVIDIGTFGGPESFFNNLNLTDRFFFSTAFYQFAQVRNRRGTFVGFADTATPDPFPPFCYIPDCFVAHAFKWEKGIKTDLGTLPGGVSSAAFWINAHGLIVGNSQNGELDPVIPGLPQIRAVLWKDGNITDLGTLGGSQSYAEAINDRGQVTGLSVNTIPDPFSFHYLFLYFSPNGTQARGFLWDKEEGMQDLGTLGGPDSFPNLINERGQVAGFSYTNSTPNPTTGIPTLHPFLWEKGEGMKDLGSFGGTMTASVNGLNERGEVVGGNFLAGDVQIHPFLWDGEKLIDLIAPPFEGSANGEAAWINEAGEVVGIAGLPFPCPGGQSQVQHAFLWRNGVITDLGTVAGTPNSQASFINSRTQIVGLSFACDFSVFNAILWEEGSMVDLNTLIPANSPFHLYSASFIDDHGQIATFGILANGDTHAVLLVPCDENHNGNSECEDDAKATTMVPSDTNARPNAVVPENLRMLLRQRLNTQYLGAPVD